MNHYVDQWATTLPWLNDPPTPRQLKVVLFYERVLSIQLPRPLTKGLVGGLIASWFGESDLRELWDRYVYVTGDVTGGGELQRFDLESLRAAKLPYDYGRIRDERRQQIAAEILREGSPFDVPPPNLEYAGKCYLFTGTFQFGQRDDCHAAAWEAGADTIERFSSRADYLVVGTKESHGWANKTYGRKIEEAVLQRLELGSPKIVTETHWVASLPVRIRAEFQKKKASG